MNIERGFKFVFQEKNWFGKVVVGGEYVELPWDKAIVDGNIVTAPAWPAHPEWLAKFLELLGTKIIHEEKVAV
ncbi:hypothetical protein JGI17_10372 [Candidatus Kryptonium thompsonii]|nr:hypothetical protein JGI17_10372 [Candidatus Kryptonium thompsoni]